jgi:hypothetical protein
VLSVWYFDTWEGSYLSSFKNITVGKKLGTQQQQFFGSDYSCSHAPDPGENFNDLMNSVILAPTKILLPFTSKFELKQNQKYMWPIIALYYKLIQ